MQQHSKQFSFTSSCVLISTPDSPLSPSCGITFPLSVHCDTCRTRMCVLFTGYRQCSETRIDASCQLGPPNFKCTSIHPKQKLIKNKNALIIINYGNCLLELYMGSWILPRFDTAFLRLFSEKISTFFSSSLLPAPSAFSEGH